MLDFFGAIMDYIQTIWDFVLNLINNLLVLIETIAQAIVLPPLLVGYAWSPIATCILAITGFSVAKMLLGRSNV